MSKSTTSKTPRKSKSPRKSTPPAAKTDAEGRPLNRKGDPKRTALDSARARALKRLQTQHASKAAAGSTIVDDDELTPPALKDAAQTPTPTTVARAAKGARGGKKAAAAKGSPTAERGGRGASGGKSAGAGKDAKAKASTPKTTKPKRLSALDAAAKVLADSDRPLRAIDMIEVMHAEGLWSSPGGKTPAATLYAAITREIAAKGSASRFAKTDTSADGSRGRFVAMAHTARRARA